MNKELYYVYFKAEQHEEEPDLDGVIYLTSAEAKLLKDIGDKVQDESDGESTFDLHSVTPYTFAAAIKVMPVETVQTIGPALKVLGEAITHVMEPNAPEAITKQAKQYCVVCVEDCDGEETQIKVSGGKNYAVGVVEDGVIHLVDWSYRSADEARHAWPELGNVVLEGSKDNKLLN